VSFCFWCASNAVLEAAITSSSACAGNLAKRQMKMCNYLIHCLNQSVSVSSSPLRRGIQWLLWGQKSISWPSSLVSGEIYTAMECLDVRLSVCATNLCNTGQAAKDRMLIVKDTYRVFFPSLIILKMGESLNPSRYLLPDFLKRSNLFLRGRWLRYNGIRYMKVKTTTTKNSERGTSELDTTFI
jgi:hypothetical protein